VAQPKGSGSCQDGDGEGAAGLDVLDVRDNEDVRAGVDEVSHYAAAAAEEEEEEAAYLPNWDEEKHKVGVADSGAYTGRADVVANEDAEVKVEVGIPGD